MSRLEYDKKRRTIVAMPSLMWGPRGENGIWLSLKPQWRFMWRGHDALYIAAWKFRLRIMKHALPSQNRGEK